jgi:Flp pilus assembly secretin CpaC
MASVIAWCLQRCKVARALTALGLAIALCTADRSAAAAELNPTGISNNTIRVSLDRATLFKVPEETATLVVGNPLIADVSVQSGGVVVVTGKSYGATNIIALDNAGAVLVENSVEVVGPNGSLVLVYRGVERESYSCTPECERRITLGDTANYFNATLGQAGNRNTQAKSAPSK